MKNKKLIIYRAAKGMLSLLMLMSATMYFFNNAMVAETFTKLGFPVYIIYPLAIAKILGVLAIWYKKNQTLREWAYGGFVFNAMLAASAHLSIGDGEAAPALLVVVLAITAYVLGKKVEVEKKVEFVS